MEELLQTTTTSEWAMTELLHNPDIMAKTKQELAATVGTVQSIQEKISFDFPIYKLCLKKQCDFIQQHLFWCLVLRWMWKFVDHHSLAHPSDCKCMGDSPKSHVANTIYTRKV